MVKVNQEPVTPSIEKLSPFPFSRDIANRVSLLKAQAVDIGGDEYGFGCLEFTGVTGNPLVRLVHRNNQLDTVYMYSWKGKTKTPFEQRRFRFGKDEITEERVQYGLIPAKAGRIVLAMSAVATTQPESTIAIHDSYAPNETTLFIPISPVWEVPFWPGKSGLGRLEVAVPAICTPVMFDSGNSCYKTCFNTPYMDGYREAYGDNLLDFLLHKGYVFPSYRTIYNNNIPSELVLDECL
jgi:hypothetical protein